jgi:hypothetical protein
MEVSGLFSSCDTLEMNSDFSLFSLNSMLRLYIIKTKPSAMRSAMRIKINKYIPLPAFNNVEMKPGFISLSNNLQPGRFSGKEKER